VSYSLPLTRAEAIARHLREEIVSGRLAPGTVIKDAELADRLGVSITPVREAIVLLSAEGLIDISPNRTRRVTDVTQKNALELIDVMCVLACAGVEWGVPNLTGADLARMRQRLDEMLAALGAGDGGAATSAGADFSTIMISASGNRELQTHVDLVVTRMRRLLMLTPERGQWRPWIDGYAEVLTLLEQDEPQAAIARYRQIYADVRAGLESGEAAAQGLVPARPDPLR
jgi:DNA-binding GntR family transcriptional regulator